MNLVKGRIDNDFVVVTNTATLISRPLKFVNKYIQVLTHYTNQRVMLRLMISVMGGNINLD